MSTAACSDWPALSPLARALLQALAETPGPQSLPRLGKRLAQSASVLMRELAPLGDTPLGSQPGWAWVRLQQQEGRWVASLTETGRAAWAQAVARDDAGLTCATAQAVDEEAPLPPPVLPVTVQRVRAGELQAATTDVLAQELPVALVFNGISHAVMMATPADLTDFALGFALSEGLLSAPSECRGIELQQGPAGLELQLEVGAAAEMRIKSHRRTLAGRTGCGLCGVDSLQQLDLALAPKPIIRPHWLAGLPPATVLRAMSALSTQQPLNAQTGAHHAAGWATPDGELRLVMEDVGRHNALDKLLGALVRGQVPLDQGFVVMSSRASYELVRKSSRLGVPLLATISAPTQLAVQIAREAGQVLYGFCRGDQAVRYAD